MYKLYAKQKVFKIVDDYQIFDEDKNPVYQVDQDFTFFGHRVEVKKLNSDLSFLIEKVIPTLLASYTVDFSDGTGFQVEQEFSLFRQRITVISDYYQLRLVGEVFSFDFDIFNGEDLVGHIEREWLAWGDTFTITVYDPVFEEELVALMIVVDHLIDMAQSR